MKHLKLSFAAIIAILAMSFTVVTKNQKTVLAGYYHLVDPVPTGDIPAYDGDRFEAVSSSTTVTPSEAIADIDEACPTAANNLCAFFVNSSNQVTEVVYSNYNP
jgi:hypothetical protein